MVASIKYRNLQRKAWNLKIKRNKDVRSSKKRPILNRPLTITKNNVTIKDSADDVMPSADSILAANKNEGIYLNKSNDSDELMSRRINRVHMTQHQHSVTSSSAKQLTPVMENSQHHSSSHYKDTCFWILYHT